jgi:hypothetical protein
MLSIFCQTKRGLHDACDLSIGQNAIFMMPMTRFSGKRGFHDVCDSILRQPRSSCYPMGWVSGKRGTGWFDSYEGADNYRIRTSPTSANAPD